MTFLIVCYIGGLILGCMTLIEWLVARIARLLLAPKSPSKRARIAR